MNPQNEQDLVTANGMLHIDSAARISLGLDQQNSYFENSNSMLAGGHGGNHIGVLGGYTLFHYACSSGNIEIFEYLVRRIV